LVYACTATLGGENLRDMSKSGGGNLHCRNKNGGENLHRELFIKKSHLFLSTF